jgi:hypothetical protein
MTRKEKSIMKSQWIPKLLTLALLATACAAQKAPPVASANLDETKANSNARITPPNSDNAAAPVALKSITWTRTGGGHLKFLIEQGPEGKCIKAKVLGYNFKPADQMVEIESEALAEGLQAMFAGTLKVEALQTDAGALTGTWTELASVDTNDKSDTIKNPVITDEKHANFLRDLEDAVREQMKSKESESN